MPDRSELLDTTLGVSQVVLTVLESAAMMAPVPFLQPAAAAALSILNFAQGARGNKNSFANLATDACGLVFSVRAIVMEKQQEGRELPSDLMLNIETLVNQLKDIEAFAKKRRGFLKRFINSTTDTGKITEYRQSLNHALATFGLHSDISIRDSVAQIAKRQEEMFEVLQRRKSLGSTDPARRYGIFSNSNVNAANSNFNTISGDHNTSAVHTTITNTNSGNVSMMNYTGYHGGQQVRQVSR